MYIGLTGGIGAGKSTALELFANLGWHTQDADVIVHQLYHNSISLQQQIAERWQLFFDEEKPEEFRKKVASIVFGNRQELKWLESVIHPEVIKVLKKSRKEQEFGICAVPLLYETQLQDCFDAVISIRCNGGLQLQRLKGRGWTDQEIARRIDCQMSMDEKCARADFVLENSGSLQNLADQCQHIGFTLKTKFNT